jgi:hypothetical protein
MTRGREIITIALLTLALMGGSIKAIIIAHMRKPKKLSSLFLSSGFFVVFQNSLDPLFYGDLPIPT